MVCRVWGLGFSPEVVQLTRTRSSLIRLDRPPKGGGTLGVYSSVPLNR